MCGRGQADQRDSRLCGARTSEVYVIPSADELGPMASGASRS